LNTIRYTETFFSIQGEGLHIGAPSIFFRTFGCNLRCKNFGLNSTDKITGANPEVAEIIKNLDLYENYNQLPLVKSGCDSYSSSYSEFKRFAKNETIDAIVDGMVDLIGDDHGKNLGIHLVITGGEPLLGWQKQYPELFEKIQDRLGIYRITFETNGTQKLNQEMIEYIRTTPWFEYTFSVSPKLSISGEKWEDAIKPDIIADYQRYSDHTYLKFVVSKDSDIEEIRRAVDAYDEAGFYGNIYLMPVGGESKLYNLNNRAVAQMALDNGWYYSPRLQVDLFDNNWGT